MTALPQVLPTEPPAEEVELFLLCDRFEALEREAIAARSAGLSEEKADRVADSCDERQRPIVAEICGRPARTASGIVRKLRAIAVYAPFLVNLERDTTTEDLLIASVLRDALGLEAERPAPELFRSARAQKDYALKLCAKVACAQSRARAERASADALLIQFLNLGAFR